MTVFASGRPAHLMPRYLSASATTEARRSVNKRRRAAGSAPTSKRFLPQRALILNPRNTDAEDVAEGMIIRRLSAAEARSLPPHVLHPLATTKPNLRTRKRRKQNLERENPVPRAQPHNGAHVPPHVLRPLAPTKPNLRTTKMSQADFSEIYFDYSAPPFLLLIVFSQESLYTSPLKQSL